MTRNKSSLVNFKSFKGPKVVFGGNNHYGATKGTKTIIRNGLKVEDTASVAQLRQLLEILHQLLAKRNVEDFLASSGRHHRCYKGVLELRKRYLRYGSAFPIRIAQE